LLGTVPFSDWFIAVAGAVGDEADIGTPARWHCCGGAVVLTRS
jgi:hypothetical protein